MAGRQYPYVWADVPWSEWQEYTRGRHEGLHLLSWGMGPHAKLATYRQLRAMGRRPGGKEPVAVLYFRCRKALRKTYAYLYLIADAKPVRPMTPAKRAAVDKALAARRTCRQCRIDAGVELPRAHRTCEPCRYALGLLEVDDHLHEYLAGEPTFSPAELAELPTLVEELATLPGEASVVARAAQRWAVAA